LIRISRIRHNSLSRFFSAALFYVCYSDMKYLHDELTLALDALVIRLNKNYRDSCAAKGGGGGGGRAEVGWGAEY
jgi:hypothetical protein